jgi:glutaredoxin
VVRRGATALGRWLTSVAAAPVEVTLYTRPGCHLCEVAKHQLQALGMTHPLRVIEVNIEDDAALEERYGTTIPVVAVGGDVVTATPIDLDAVRQAVLLARRGGG